MYLGNFGRTREKRVKHAALHACEVCRVLSKPQFKDIRYLCQNVSQMRYLATKARGLFLYMRVLMPSQSYRPTVQSATSLYITLLSQLEISLHLPHVKRAKRNSFPSLLTMFPLRLCLPVRFC